MISIKLDFLKGLIFVNLVGVVIFCGVDNLGKVFFLFSLESFRFWG